MNSAKIGKLLLQMRKEKQLTQKQLAEKIHVSDKAISKWERGYGCPDISLINNIAQVFQITAEAILEGELETNSNNGGNMKRIKFYTCPQCGNIMTATGESEITCCGRKLKSLVAKPANEEHKITIQDSDGELYIRFDHEMSKLHFISFVASVSYDRVLLVRLYPEQGSELRIPKLNRATIYIGCNTDGLWIQQ